MISRFLVIALISLLSHANEIEKKNLLKGLELRFDESHPNDGERSETDIEARFLINENALKDNSSLYQKHFDLIRAEASLKKTTKLNLSLTLKKKINLLKESLKEYRKRAMKTRSSSIETLNKIREIDFALKEYSFQSEIPIAQEATLINLENVVSLSVNKFDLKKSLAYKLLVAENAIEKNKSQKDSPNHGMKFVGLTSGSKGDKSVKLGYLISFGDKSQSTYDIHMQKFSERKNLEDIAEDFFVLKKELYSNILKVQRLRSTYKFTKKSMSSDPSLLSKSVLQTYDLKAEVIQAEMDLLKSYSEFVIFYGDQV